MQAPLTHSFLLIRFISGTPMFKKCRKLIFLLPIVLLVFGMQGYGQGTWTALTHAPSHLNGGGMLLLSDGSVLAKSFSGGADGYGNIYDKLTPDINGSYINGTWSQIAPMNNTRLYFSSQVLMDGRVYVAGGEYGTGIAAGETYNPLTNTWTNTPSPGGTVSDANSEILPDGRVMQALVTGNLKGNVIYNPATNTYSAAPSCNGIHNESAWVKLADNSVLFVDRLSTNSERYIPSLNQWVTDATVPVALYDPFGLETGGAVLLPDGRAFFLGSSGHTAYYTPSGTSSPGSWAAGPDMPTGKGTPDAAAAMLVDGKILMAVSPVPTSANHFPSPTSFYEFDYLTNTYTPRNAPNGSATYSAPCYQTNMLDLPNGQVLFCFQNATQYYVYTPSGSPLVSGKPVISSISPNGCGQFRITGNQFNGISQGATYGDDWQMSTNYPVIRLTSGANVYYARTFNWNSTGVQRGLQADTAQFTLPAGLPAGTYSLVVTANGIASDPVSFNPVPVVSFSGLSGSYQLTDPAVVLTGSPAGGSFSGPGISGNTFTPASAGTGGPYTISYMYCGTTSTQQTTVGSCAPPPIPGTITATGGNTKVCPGDSKSYHVNLVSGATTYAWTPPPGAIISSGQGSNNITVSYTSGFLFTDSLRVAAVNGCGSSEPKGLKITRNNPAQPDVITGQNYGVCSLNGVPYAVTNKAGLTYSWSFNTGNALISSGQGSSSVTGDFAPAFATGIISVVASNACGNSIPRSRTIYSKPATPATISGANTVCSGQQNVLYSISSVPSATFYKWIGPSGSHVSDGINTSTGNNLVTTATAVTVNFGSASGNVSVRAQNACGTGTIRSLAVTFNCREGNAISELLDGVNLYPNPARDEINLEGLHVPNNLYQMKMVSMVGQVVWETQVNVEDHSFKIPVQMVDWKAGIYSLLITSGSYTKVLRVQKL